MKRLLFVSSLIALLASTQFACGGKSETPDEQPIEEPAEETEEVAEEPAEETVEPMTMAQRLEKAASGDHRSADNIARNDQRHPVETLTFFGLEPDMTVVELWSGGGWYTEVLAPALSDEGKLVAANFAAKKDDPEHYRTKLRKKMDERVANDPVFANVVHGTFEPGVKVEAGEPGSADMVLSFRNVHSFIGSGIEKEVFAESFKVLKPGGIMGVVQHRAAEGTDPKVTAKSGYVSEAHVIELAKAAGFELVEKSDINANPKDTRDHAEGVWTLPPSLRLGDKDKEKYLAIGESDRMTLKFRKPAEKADAATEGDTAAE